MARSLWKGPYIDHTILKQPSGGEIANRKSVILPCVKGEKYQVTTGNRLMNITIREEFVGHKFGEFVSTKKIAQYKRKSKLKRGKR